MSALRVFIAIVLTTPALPALAAPPCAGLYEAHEPEIATQLELRADGSFRYALSYGAIDEAAEGRWRIEHDRAVLISDPVTPPAFTLVSDQPLAGQRLSVQLELPGGISQQYFTVAARLTDGAIVGRQFSEAEALEIELAPGNPAVALRVDLPVFSLSSPEFALRGTLGHALRLRFSANDLGKVAFADQVLAVEDGALLIERHERRLAFRRVGRCQR